MTTPTVFLRARSSVQSKALFIFHITASNMQKNIGILYYNFFFAKDSECFKTLDRSASEMCEYMLGK